MVRTNIDIDDELLAEAQALSGSATKKRRAGLELMVRLGRQAEVRSLRGRLSWDGDLAAARRDDA